MSLSGKDIATLKSELTNDPLVREYSGMSAQVAAGDINTVIRPVDRDSVSISLMQAEVVGNEYVALSQAKRDAWRDILSADPEIKNTNMRNQIMEIWGAGTATRSNLAALQTKLVSRATELGIGKVKVGDIIQGRM